MIAGTIGVAEGVLDPTRVEEDLEEAGAERQVARAVGQALGPVIAGRKDKGPSATLPDSGAESGLARF
jgi:hypothetical protein